MRRFFAALLLLAILAAAGGFIANTAYQAGLSAAAVTSGAVVQPVVVPAYGFGWSFFGLGFGFLGFLGTLLFLFLVFGLIRVIVFGGHHRHGWGGQGGPWADGRGAGARTPWEMRARGTFEDWHRTAHGTAPDAPPPPPAAPPTSGAAEPTG